MQPILSGKQIAIVLTDGFEQAELTGPREALQQAGATTVLISDKPGKVQGFNHDAKADQFDVDQLLADADPQAFDGVLLPGGVMNADTIRMDPQARRFVQAIDAANKPVAVICHGAWLLVSAGLVDGHTLTSWPSLQDDIRNAGGNWVDQEVVVDANWVSSRKPADIPAFNGELVELLGSQDGAAAGAAAAAERAGQGAAPSANA